MLKSVLKKFSGFKSCKAKEKLEAKTVYQMESLQAQEKQKLCGGRGQYCCVPGCGSARYDSNKIKTKIGLFTFVYKI